MLRLRIYSLLASLWLASTAFATENAWQNCEVALLPRAPEISEFVQTKFRTAIHTQCGGSCVIAANFSHMESLLNRELSSEWFFLKAIEYYFFDTLPLRRISAETIWQYRPRRNLTKDKRPSHELFFGTGDSRGHILANKVGVVDKADFRFTDEFTREMNEYRKATWLNADHLLLHQVLLARLELELNRLEFTLLQEPSQEKRNQIFDDFQTKMRGLLNRALAGFRGSYSPQEHFANLNKLKRFQSDVSLDAKELISRFPEPMSASEQLQMENMVRDAIDRGYNLELGLHQHDSFILPGTGILDLPRNFNHLEFHLKHFHSAHGVVVEGYHLDANGRIDWILVKNSHGNDLYDAGYNRISMRYLVALLLDVRHQSLPITPITK